MKFLVLLFISVNAYAQSAAVWKPCDYIQGQNNLTQDFGGLCKYEQSNAALPAATANRVVYLGDSITEFWRNGIVGLDAKDTINRGYSGQTTSQMLVRFRADVIELKPRIVHIMAGTNDLAGNTGPVSLDRIKNNIRTMCELAQMHGIRVVLGSVLPAKAFNWRPGMKPAEDIKTLNKWIKTYAENSGHVYADYHSPMSDNEGGIPRAYADDGVHPNATGYSVMIPVAQAAIFEAHKR